MRRAAAFVEAFVSNIVAAIFPLLDVLDEGAIPFAADVGADFFCFDYRADDDHPSVVFWSVDWGSCRRRRTLPAS